MEKGNISNDFAPAVAFDLELIVKPKDDTVWDRLKNRFGVHKYVVREQYILLYLKQLWVLGYRIFLINRTGIPLSSEDLEEMGCEFFNKLIVESSDEGLREIFTRTDILWGFFAKDFMFSPPVVGRAGRQFTSWREAFEVILKGE